MVFEIHDYDAFKAAIDEICAFLSSRAVSKEKVFDCKLVCHELIGNVLQHSNGSARLQVECDGEYVQITVQAETAFCPTAKASCPPTSAERGRGLYLIDCVSVEQSYGQNGEIIVKIPTK